MRRSTDSARCGAVAGARVGCSEHLQPQTASNNSAESPLRMREPPRRSLAEIAARRQNSRVRLGHFTEAASLEGASRLALRSLRSKPIERLLTIDEPLRWKD